MSLRGGGAHALVAGVDVGSTLAKAVVLDTTGKAVGSAVLPTGASIPYAAERVLFAACAGLRGGPGALSAVVATGYGRFKVEAGDEVVPEIACHARGAAFLCPGVATLIDIGGQDTKVIRVGPGGEVLDFRMNDKCAAGTGRFLESAAEALSLDVDAFSAVAAGAARAAPVSSVCAVFAESEVAALLADGRPLPEILRGLAEAVARRVAGLAARAGVVTPVALSGGVSSNRAVVEALARVLGTVPVVPERAIHAGAIGAALYAADRAIGVGAGPRAARAVS